MARGIRLLDVYVASEGAALFRHVLEADDAFVEARLDNIRRFLDHADDPRYATALQVPELSVEEGYAAWSEVYDTMSNALIEAEEPVVRDAVAGIPAGRAIDVACGTGRHAAWLAEAGHEIEGVDRSEAMLAIARRKVPSGNFRAGDMEAIPCGDDEFDIGITALALTHLADPTAAIAELARVVRPGGRVVVTDAHPTFVLIQGQALFSTPRGMAFVRNHVHLHGTYLRAFRTANLEVLDCQEPMMKAEFGNGLQAPVAEALNALWKDIPVGLVWTLAKKA
jgi:ubiquinone/menaquinone biosynthesis C-methylase UbiE